MKIEIENDKIVNVEYEDYSSDEFILRDKIYNLLEEEKERKKKEKRHEREYLMKYGIIKKDEEFYINQIRRLQYKVNKIKQFEKERFNYAEYNENEVPIYFVMYQSIHDVYPDMAFINPMTALKRMEMKYNNKIKDNRYCYTEEYDENGKLIMRISMVNESRKHEHLFITQGKLILSNGMKLEDVENIYFYVDSEEDKYIAYPTYNELKANIKNCLCDRWCKLSHGITSTDIPIDLEFIDDIINTYRIWYGLDYKTKTKNNLPF